MDKEFELIYEVAKRLSGEQILNNYIKYKHVGCALLTDSGNVYTGISINAKCGIGFCAEHSAISEMLKNDESKIKKIISVSNGKIIPPCGRCRELMYQLNPKNMNTEVLINIDKLVKLKDLLPYPWSLDQMN